MKKIALITITILAVLAGHLFGQEDWNKFLKNETIQGRLDWEQYGDFPYAITLGKRIVAVRVNLDKTNKNRQMHKLVGKEVRVSGPMYVVTVNTEYRNLEFIDLTKGKGSIKEVK